MSTSNTPTTERVHTLVIGGGQAGLATGWHLARRGADFAILDAGERVGDAWRGRWDSLRLFTPAAYDGLPGMPFPAHPHYFPTKDEFADYLEGYAAHFELPVRSGVRVEALEQEGGIFVARSGERRWEAQKVIVAMANYQRPWTPAWASDVHPSITRLHSAAYRNPSQLRPGPVLLVGAGNSASEIAMELARHGHTVQMAGRDVGQIPFRPRSRVGRLLVPVVLRGLFYRILTLDTPVGRRARPRIVGKGGPLIRVKKRDLRAAGVERLPRVRGVRDGLPELADGRVLEPANVVWATGYRPGFQTWIRLPVHGDGDGHEPRHERGRVPHVPGLYFVGLHFQRAFSSAMIHGVGRDAGEVVEALMGGAVGHEGRPQVSVAPRGHPGDLLRGAHWPRPPAPGATPPGVPRPGSRRHAG